MDAELSPVSRESKIRYALWILWICARLVLAFYLGHPDVFFYQGF